MIENQSENQIFGLLVNVFVLRNLSQRYHVGWHDTMSRLCGREFEVSDTIPKAKGVRIQDGFAAFALPWSGVTVVGVPRQSATTNLSRHYTV